MTTDKGLRIIINLVVLYELIECHLDDSLIVENDNNLLFNYGNIYLVILLAYFTSFKIFV